MFRARHKNKNQQKKGVDAWFTSAVIHEHNLSEKVSGFIGTVPWQPGLFEEEFYTHDDEVWTIYNKSHEILEEFKRPWKKQYQKDPSFMFGLKNPGATTYYGWESAHLMAYALQELELKGDLKKYLTGKLSTENFQEKFGETLKSISYYGITGKVELDERGDGNRGFYAFGSVKTHEIRYFGYIVGSVDDSEDYFSFSKMDNISFPPDFGVKL